MSGTKRVVLHYVGYDEAGGGILAVVRGLAAESGARVIVGMGRNFGPAPAGWPRVWRGPAIRGERIAPGNAWAAWRVARRVRRWLRGGEHRVFHGHSRAGLLVALWLHAWGERRVVVSVHCYGRQRWFYRWAAGRLGARLFWLSPAMRSYYGAEGEGWAQCLPGGVRVAPQAAKPRGETLRVAGVGALVRWKRWDLVLRALAGLDEAERARVRFEHIGEALADEDSRRYAGELQRLTHELGLAKNVSWRGREAGSVRLLAASDVLVVASENEPFSMAMLEALAAGVPVLASDSGGARDLVREGESGWLFRSGDAADLARRLGELAREELRWPEVARVQQVAPEIGRIAAQWREVYARVSA
jgi:glycosyltransferase involved in cell wall biosynthesis